MIKLSLAQLQCHKGLLYTSGLELVIILTNSYIISHLLGNLLSLVPVCTVIARSLMWVKLPSRSSVIIPSSSLWSYRWVTCCTPNLYRTGAIIQASQQYCIHIIKQTSQQHRSNKIAALILHGCIMNLHFHDKLDSCTQPCRFSATRSTGLLLPVSPYQCSLCQLSTNILYPSFLITILLDIWRL